MHEIFKTMLSGLDELSIYTTKPMTEKEITNICFDTPMTRDDVPDVQPKTRVVKPLYILIKVDVDADIVYNRDKAEKYAENHCKSMEYELVDYHYPMKYSERHYPYIAL